MSDPKSFASLSPTLLARKGGARPAMRPQWQPLGSRATDSPLPVAHAGLEDLGWNDMGHGDDDVAAQTVVRFGGTEAGLEAAPPAGSIPAVVRQQDSLADQIAEPAPLIPLAAHRHARASAAAAEAAQIERRSAIAQGRRAAFTLRVDEARHLKLRLACTVQGRSAQQIVTEALDRLLDELPGLDDLAKRVKRR